MELWKAINGNKTYLGMIAAGVMGFGIANGWWTWDTAWVQSVVAIVGTWTGVAMRHAAKKGPGK